MPRALPLTIICILALAGCTSSAAPELTTRQTVQDSQVLLTVDSVSDKFSYGELLIIVNNEPFKFGGKMDRDQRLYEVVGKANAGDDLALGDIIKLPVSGAVDVELRHSGGASLQQLELKVPDNTAPSSPTPIFPQPGATGVPRQAQFSWSSISDPSGIRYQIDYWVASQGVNAPHNGASDLDGSSYSIPGDQQLFPATTYRWSVRAVDGAGNVGAWSDPSEFTTSLG